MHQSSVLVVTKNRRLSIVPYCLNKLTTMGNSSTRSKLVTDLNLVFTETNHCISSLSSFKDDFFTYALTQHAEHVKNGKLPTVTRQLLR